MTNERTQVIFDEWDTYVSTTEKGPMFISFDLVAGREDLTSTLRHGLQVRIPIREPGESGGPGNEEAEHLWAMEDELNESLAANGVVCRQVGRVTFGGTRVLVYQMDDIGPFIAVFQPWSERQDQYEIRVSEDEGWEFFENIIRPNRDDWLFMSDARVVQLLIQSGSNREKEHSLEFVFNGEPKKLEAVASALAEHGFEPLPSQTDPQSGETDLQGGQVVLAKSMPLQLHDITSISRALADLADDLGVQYDGWGAAVVE